MQWSSFSIQPAFQPSMTLACHSSSMKSLKMDLAFASWQISSHSSVLGHTAIAQRQLNGTRIGMRQVDPPLLQFLQWLPVTQLNWWWEGGLLLLGADVGSEYWDLKTLFVFWKEMWQIKVMTEWRGCLHMSSIHNSNTLKHWAGFPRLSRIVFSVVSHAEKLFLHPLKKCAF